MSTDLFSPGGMAALGRYADSKMILALDYDGTLAPIVDDPARALMRPQTRELLQEVVNRYPVLIVSGRAQGDVLKKLRGIRVREVIGNHGIEPLASSDRLAEEVQSWIPTLSRVTQLEGVTIEDKGFSVAIHYRHSPQPDHAMAAILEVASSLKDVRVLGGKCVVNLLPKDCPNKGTAVERELERLEHECVVYLGDDETDEDVFALEKPGRLMGIRVGADRPTRASFQIGDQLHVDQVLRALLELRSARSAS